eukprot:CAMPEP_0198684298 /NCGR_PEP_ID=MMETSP1468-20131203/11992_1 /TAXON_ID=1461545 /ORGANISM="Mantoniella sp, Strain CCMP1436" /LENGTH=91 /DNA_ID=CAMNT_0044428991 /DNA_START=836 /DNA_END=1111 /DNA_ORIENTATION=-
MAGRDVVLRRKQALLGGDAMQVAMVLRGYHLLLGCHLLSVSAATAWGGRWRRSSAEDAGRCRGEVIRGSALAGVACFGRSARASSGSFAYV